MRLCQLGRRAGVIGSVALVVSGAAVRLTVRDHNLVAGLICYPTSPAAMCLLLAAALIFAPRRWRRLRVLLVVSLPVCLGWTYATQYVGSPAVVDAAATGRPSFRFMLWNACDGQLGWSRIHTIIHEEAPDILALAEAETLKTGDAAWFAEHYPDYHRVDLPRRLMLLSRFPIRRHRRLAWIEGANYEAVEIATEAGPLTVLFSDVDSNLLKSRQAPIEKLHEVLKSLSGPVIMTGDLNTPVDSRYLDPVRDEYRNAFEVSGHGLHTTWPMPLPVIAIDHVWGNRAVQFHRTRILWTSCSDHRPVIADFSILPATRSGNAADD